MAHRIIIDLKEPLLYFVQRLNFKGTIPPYVLNGIVDMVFDVLIYELEEIHEEPELSRLGNFYRDHLERDPVFMQRFLESFFLLLRYIANVLRDNGFYHDEGLSYRPEKNNNNRSIVVKKFDNY